VRNALAYQWLGGTGGVGWGGYEPPARGWGCVYIYPPLYTIRQNLLCHNATDSNNKTVDMMGGMGKIGVWVVTGQRRRG